MPARSVARQPKNTPDRWLAHQIGAHLMRYDSNELNLIWRRRITTSMEFLVRRYNRLEIIGQELIPTVPTIFCPVPHYSHVDHVAISVALKDKIGLDNFRIAADSRYFFGDAAIGYFYKNVLIALPIERGKKEYSIDDLKPCIEVLQSRKSLVWYPEGGREYDRLPMELQPGAFIIALRYKVNLMPVIVEGTYGILRPGASIPWPRKATIRFLPTLTPEDYVSNGKRLRSSELMDLYLERVSPYWRPPSPRDPTA